MLERLAPIATHLGVEPGEVPLRRLTGDERQRPFRPLAADQQWNRIPRRLRARLLPDVAHRLDPALQLLEALLLAEERDAEDRVLVFVPARADAEQEAATGKGVDRGGNLRQDRREPECHR